MEVVGLFVTAFIVGLSGAMMPGPLLTATIGETARHGLVAAPLIVLGHALLELLLVGAVAAGLAVFLTPSISQWLAIIGGIFLLLMGWGMVRDVFAGRVSLVQVPGVVSVGEAGPSSSTVGNSKPYWIRAKLVATGILISLANPYWIIWWATVGLGYITMALNAGEIGLVSFYTGHVFSDLTWYFMIGAVIAGGRKFFSDAIYRGVLVVCGVFLFGLGGYFIYYGVSL